jgi:hypothetical protein
MFRAVTDYDYGVVIAELHAGAGPHLRQKLSECDDSHRAEITNAIGMGLVPPV